MLRIPDFTMQEIENIKEKANFTEQEERLFDLRNKEKSLVQCAYDMNISMGTAKRISSRVTMKVLKVL